jgi:hypothetical protein
VRGGMARSSYLTSSGRLAERRDGTRRSLQVAARIKTFLGMA